MSSDNPLRRLRERFGTYNNLRSNPFSNREKILDLSIGSLDPLAQMAQSMLESSYTVDSLSRFGNTFRARVLGVTTGKPARHQYPDLYSNSTTVSADGVKEIPDYYICVLRDETDYFTPNPDQFCANPESYVALSMMQGSAISDKPVNEMLELFGEGDIVEVYKPNQNSWNGARVKKVIVRNNFDVALPPNFSPSRYILGPLAGSPFFRDGAAAMGENAQLGGNCTLGSRGLSVIRRGLTAVETGYYEQLSYGFWIWGRLERLDEILNDNNRIFDLQQAGFKNLCIPIDDINSSVRYRGLFTSDGPSERLARLVTGLIERNFNLFFLTFPLRTNEYLSSQRINNLIRHSQALGISGIQLDLEENWQANGRYNGVELLPEEESNNRLRDLFKDKGIRIDVTTIASTARGKALRPLVEFADNYIAQSYYQNDRRFGPYDANTYGMGSTHFTVMNSFKNSVIPRLEAEGNTRLKVSYGLGSYNQEFGCEPAELTMAKNLLGTKGSLLELEIAPRLLSNELWYFKYNNWNSYSYVKNFLLNKNNYFQQVQTQIS